MKNYARLFTAIIFLTLLPVVLHGADISGLDRKNFNRYWKVESESPDYKLTFLGDTLDIISPKGLTLWRKEKMKGDVTIEYDACVVVKGPDDRLSDLNCFWMASDPAKADIWKDMDRRGGVFLNCYALRLYYLGYGGNHNSTTRFRRYDGDRAGITDPDRRPDILREYTDSANLLTANKWYHIKITTRGNRTEYYIDGRRLVDFRDPEPLREGWFGFRTTLSHTRLTNFSYTEHPEDKNVNVPLHWIGDTPGRDKPVTFGIPFNPGELTSGESLTLIDGSGRSIPADNWVLARWHDGSVKWLAMAGVIPGGASDLHVISPDSKKKEASTASSVKVSKNTDGYIIDNGMVKTYIPLGGHNVIDSIVLNGCKIATNGRLVASTQSTPVSEATESVTFTNYTSLITGVDVERLGNHRALVRLDGVHADGNGREWLPFTLRLYFYGNSPEIHMTHTFIFDGDQDKDFIRSLGVRFNVPMREAPYNRHIAFSTSQGGVWSEPVQPLAGRRTLRLDPDRRKAETPSMQQRQMNGERIPEVEAFDEANRNLIADWATWDSYRLSQLTPDGYTVRKRAKTSAPWIGTFAGDRSEGYTFAGDISGGLGIRIKDFRESCPSGIAIDSAASDTAVMTAWLWAPDAEPMDLRHYDDRAHGLNASYEDVQEGMSTPLGIARTSELTLFPSAGYSGKSDFAADAAALGVTGVLLPTPEYLHSRKAFGIWSLPDSSNIHRAAVEKKLNAYIEHYKKAIEEHKWYGFWHYGDVMHAYDPVRHEWMYDVGGFAWDNTELASPMWLWYSFLRTGDEDIWRMAEAMCRHTGEVDVYHLGDNKGLGSRHNVSHWGCGAKESRISQAAWNRFYHYLTADERCGDLMSEVTDADQLLYTLDPMRLAEPRSQYPCTAPARLRIGPDWLAYAGNWMTEWERTGNLKYRDKILTGMKSICALPSRMFTGPLALGYDPATGTITSECDPSLQTTNHLMTIMGGFEIMNELQMMIDLPEWNDAWLDHAGRYKEMARKIRRNKFRVSRLQAYAAYRNMDRAKADEAWDDLLTRLEHSEAPQTTIRTLMPPEVPSPREEMLPISTNDAAMWSLDAIYMQEVIPMDADRK